MYVYHISRDRVINFLMKFYYYFQIQLNDILLIARVVQLDQPGQDTPTGPSAPDILIKTTNWKQIESNKGSPTWFSWELWK